MNPTVQELVNEAQRNLMLFYKAPQRSLSWTDQLFVWGGWPLVIAFYGGLFVAAWIGFYLFLKKGNYK